MLCLEAFFRQMAEAAICQAAPYRVVSNQPCSSLVLIANAVHESPVIMQLSEFRKGGERESSSRGGNFPQD